MPTLPCPQMPKTYGMPLAIRYSVISSAPLIRAMNRSRGSPQPAFLTRGRAPITDKWRALPAAFNPARQVIEIDGELFGLADVGFELFNVGPREFRRRIARRLGQQLDHGAVFQHDRPDHRFRNRSAGYHNAVIFQKYRTASTWRACNGHDHRVTTNLINSVGVGPERTIIQRARL